jgi:hypothetical protein
MLIPHPDGYDTPGKWLEAIMDDLGDICSLLKCSPLEAVYLVMAIGEQLGSGLAPPGGEEKREWE